MLPLIVIGGGNTFALLKKMQEEDLLDMIFRRVKAGVPYVLEDGATQRVVDAQHSAIGVAPTI